MAGALPASPKAARLVATNGVLTAAAASSSTGSGGGGGGASKAVGAYSVAEQQQLQQQDRRIIYSGRCGAAGAAVEGMGGKGGGVGAGGQAGRGVGWVGGGGGGSGGSSPRVTLRMAAPYDAVRDATKLEKRIDRAQVRMGEGKGGEGRRGCSSSRREQGVCGSGGGYPRDESWGGGQV